MSQNDNTVDDSVNDDIDQTQQFTMYHNGATQLHFEAIEVKKKDKEYIHMNKDTIICPDFKMGNAYHNHTIQSTLKSDIHRWTFKILSFIGGYMYFGIIRADKITKDDTISFKELGGAYAIRQCGTIYSENSNQEGYKLQNNQIVPEIEEDDVLLMEYNPAARHLSFTIQKNNNDNNTTVTIPGVRADENIQYRMAVNLYSTKIIQMKYEIEENKHAETDEAKYGDDDDDDDDDLDEEGVQALADALGTPDDQAKALIRANPRESKLMLVALLEEQSKKKALYRHNNQVQQHISNEKEKLIKTTMDMNTKLLDIHQKTMEQNTLFSQREVSAIFEQSIFKQQEKNWRAWTCDMVIAWISVINEGKFQKYADTLVIEIYKQNVGGINLPKQSVESIKSWGITDEIDISYLLKAIDDLTKN